MLQSVTTADSFDFYQDIPYSISSVPGPLVEGGVREEQGRVQVGALAERVTEVGLVDTAVPQWRGGMIKVEVSDLLDTFRVCLENNFQWIEDFRGDAIWITEDLNQVIEAFENMRRETMRD